MAVAEWIRAELGTLDFGNAKLDERQAILLDKLAAKPAESLPAATGSWAELIAAYRFCDNKRITGEKVLAPHRASTIERIRRQSVALIPQDTTELEFDRDPEQGFGKLTYESRIGLMDHMQIAVTPEGQHLGVTRCHVWARRLINPHAKTHNRDRATDDKESQRWLVSYRDACQIARQAPETLVVSLSDREGDLFECFVEGAAPKRGKTAEWIIRSAQNRRLVPSPESASQAAKLRIAAAELPVLGTGTVKIPARSQQSARVAQVEYRAGQLTIKAPPRKGDKLPDMAVNAVFVTEINPPPDVEPLDWLLLTSLPIDTLPNVLQVVDYYASRWQIEVFFKVLKQGCAVERLQLQTARRVENCLALYCIVAWRILHVTMLGRESSGRQLRGGLLESGMAGGLRGRPQKSAPPEKPPSLGEFLELAWPDWAATSGGPTTARPARKSCGARNVPSFRLRPGVGSPTRNGSRPRLATVTYKDESSAWEHPSRSSASRLAHRDRLSRRIDAEPVRHGLAAVSWREAELPKRKLPSGAWEQRGTQNLSGKLLIPAGAAIMFSR